MKKILITTVKINGREVKVIGKQITRLLRKDGAKVINKTVLTAAGY